MNISQNTKGNNNISEINIFESKNTVDFLPEDMNSLLDYLSDESILKDVQFSFDVPNLEKKNLKNGIDENYYDFMKDDFSYFQDIDEILQKDNLIKQKYSRAKRLLQQKYLASYQEKMKEFISDVTSKHKKDTFCSDYESIKLQRLLHYMYSCCDIGIRP